VQVKVVGTFCRSCCALLAATGPLYAALSLAPAPPSTNLTSRVIVVQDEGTTIEFAPRLDKVEALVERALTNLTRTATLSAAWQSLVKTQDVIGIKVLSAPGPTVGSRKAVVEAVVRGLLAAGHPANRIVIWDKQAADLRRAGFFELADRLGVAAAGSAEAGYDSQVAYDNSLLGRLVWGDSEFGKHGDGIGRKSFVSRLLTGRITRIISVVPLLNHNEAGVSGHLYSLAMGSVDNTLRFESEAARMAQAVPEIYALPALGDRVALNITDALLGQYHGEESPLLHYTAVLDQLWVSLDPVALDAMAFRELERLQRQSKAPAARHGKELLDNAALLELGQPDARRVLIEEFH